MLKRIHNWLWPKPEPKAKTPFERMCAAVDELNSAWAASTGDTQGFPDGVVKVNPWVSWEDKAVVLVGRRRGFVRGEDVVYGSVQ